MSTKDTKKLKREMRTFKFRVWAKTAKRYLRSYKNEGFIFDYSHSGCLSDTDLEEYGGWDLGSCTTK